VEFVSVLISLGLDGSALEDQNCSTGPKKGRTGTEVQEPARVSSSLLFRWELIDRQATPEAACKIDRKVLYRISDFSNRGEFKPWQEQAIV